MALQRKILPSRTAVDIKSRHASILLVLCQDNTICISYILEQGVVKKLLEFRQPWGTYSQVATALVRRCTDQCGSDRQKALALRAGIFQLAWSLLGDFGVERAGYVCGWARHTCLDPCEDNTFPSLVVDISYSFPSSSSSSPSSSQS